jgi:transposase
MSTDAHLLPSDPARLKALLLSERQQHGQIVAQYEETVQSQQKKLRQLEHRLAQLLRRYYGPKQERVDPDQLMLFSQDELQQLIEELSEDNSSQEPHTTSDRKKRRPGHGRRSLPEHLPREQVLYELSEAEQACPGCGQLRQEIGSQTSEQLEVVPAQVKVIEHVRKKYVCRVCEEYVAIAPKPPQPIDKGLPGPGLLAHTVLSKYGDHLPLYRQEDILSRHGVVIRRSTLCDWIASAADLAKPLWLRMRESVLQSHVIHTDDTTVKMLDPRQGKARTCRFWAYLGDAAHPYSLFDFTESRSRDGPARFLEGFQGYLQADAYGGYDGIYAGGDVIEAACLAHCRRYWWEARTTDSARAHEALSYIGRLYKLEEQFLQSQLVGDNLRDARQEHSLPILDGFRIWLDEQQEQVLPKSPIGAAFRYTLNQWDALVRYTEDGLLSIDNNVAERTVKIPAIGRKNWLFVASKTGGDRAAILFSLIASCKANQVEPFAYLQSLFRELPRSGSDSELDELLPDRYLASHPEHRWQIDELRAEERKRSREIRIRSR